MSAVDSTARARPEERDVFDAQVATASWMQDLAPYGIFTTDRELVIRSWNQWLVTHSGLDAPAVVGRRLPDFWDELLGRRLEQYFRHALDGQVSVLSAALHRYLLPLPTQLRETGSPFMLQTVRIAPLTVAEKIVGTITLIEDVTQREHQSAALRRQQEYDRLLSEALALLLRSDDPMAIAAELFPQITVPLKLDLHFTYLVSADGKKLELQASGGLAPEVRKAFSTLLPDEGFCGLAVSRRTPVVESFLQNNSTERARFARQLGVRSYAAFPLMVGERLLGTVSFGSYARDTLGADDVEFLAKLAQYLSIAVDRAQQQRALRTAQEDLRRHAESLESTVSERTAKLHESIVQLESFSYTVAHDLRAPIRSLTGFSEILLADYGRMIPEDGRDLLERLRRACSRLDALTRDLLQFSRIARQEVRLERVSVAEMIEDIVSVTPGLQGGVVTTVPPLDDVWAQRTLLQQCLSNLFDNALKFARLGVRPAIVVRSESRGEPASVARPNIGAPFQPPAGEQIDQTGPRRRIWVEDNGIGIPAAAHRKIFGIFERLPGLTPVEGTGIGLAIVARATEQMGGACGVESTPGEGSRFWLEFAVPPSA